MSSHRRRNRQAPGAAGLTYIKPAKGWFSTLAAQLQPMDKTKNGMAESDIFKLVVRKEFNIYRSNFKQLRHYSVELVLGVAGA